MDIEDRFEDMELDPHLWLPNYLPHWSSRVASRARYSVGGGQLRLRIDLGQPEWCPEFDPDVRVSSLQTAHIDGQHRFRKGLVVRERQPRAVLYAPRYGRLEIVAKAVADADCMVAFWLIGLEDEPEHAAEICVMEIFGRDVHGDHALVGMGIHPFGDPMLRDDFSRERFDIDARESHAYTVEWLEGGIRYYVDGRLARESAQAPAYPMQVMLGIYQFGEAQAAGTYPKEFVVERFRGSHGGAG